MYQKGKEVLKWYNDLTEKPNTQIDKKWATKITHTIMQWAKDKRRKFTNDDLKYISTQVVTLFPSESEVWFIFLPN